MERAESARVSYTGRRAELLSIITPAFAGEETRNRPLSKLTELLRRGTVPLSSWLRRQEANERLATAFPKIRGVIYDKDDTMVNAELLHAQAWNEALSAHGKLRYEDVPAPIRRGWVGEKEVFVAETIVRELALKDVTGEQLLREKTAVFQRISAERLEAMPGLLESLESFRKRGYLIGMATSGDRASINTALGKLNIGSYFTVTISGQDVKVGKPDPEPYRMAAQRLGLKPEECVVIEDARNGLESGKAAGCWTIGVINPNTQPQDFSKADAVLASLNEVALLGFRKRPTATHA